MAQKWFTRFKDGKYGRPVQFDENKFQALIKKESRQTTRELAQKMAKSNLWNVSKQPISCILNKWTVLEAIQLKKLDRRYNVIIHHDNVANITKRTVKQLGWDVQPQPPYYPNLVLFRFLSNNLSSVRFNNDVKLKTAFDEVSESKLTDFYRRGI